MDIHKVEELVKDAVRDADLRPEEIPSIDLYLDQITSLVSEKRKEGAERFFDRELTKTMVNNYSKDGLIAPIKGKKYSKDQILQLLLVYSLKNTLSIGEIKRILQNAYALPEYSSQMLEKTYTKFLDIKQTEREETWPTVSAFLKQNELDPENEEDFLTCLLGLAAMSSYLKNVVQALLEAHYPDLNEEKEREERERKEQAKRTKEEKKARQAAEKEAEKEAGKEAEKGTKEKKKKPAAKDETGPQQDPETKPV